MSCYIIYIYHLYYTLLTNIYSEYDEKYVLMDIDWSICHSHGMPWVSTQRKLGHHEEKNPIVTGNLAVEDRCPV